jgi:hypothetical protein
MCHCSAALSSLSSAAVQTQSAFCPHFFVVLLCSGTALISLPTAKGTTQQETYGRHSTALLILLT